MPFTSDSDEVSLLMFIDTVGDGEESKGNRFREARLMGIIDDDSNVGVALCMDRHRRPGLGNGILRILFWKEEHDTERSAMQPSLQLIFRSSPIAFF